MARVRPRRSGTRGSPKRPRRFDQRPSRILGSQAREHSGAAKRSLSTATAISRTRGRWKIRCRWPDVAVALHPPPRRAPGLRHASAIETPPGSAASSLLSRRLSCLSRRLSCLSRRLSCLSRRLSCSRISRRLVFVLWGSRHFFLAKKVCPFRQNASSMALILVRAEKLEAVYRNGWAQRPTWLSGSAIQAPPPQRRRDLHRSWLRCCGFQRGPERARRGRGENVCPFA